jgi:pimeloyl-ACP methyl ester carboxylesterase
MFPLEHGEALAGEIPGARLLTLEEAGHGVDRADWETIALAIVRHTANGDQLRGGDSFREHRRS